MFRSVKVSLSPSKNPSLDETEMLEGKDPKNSSEELVIDFLLNGKISRQFKSKETATAFAARPEETGCCLSSSADLLVLCLPYSA